MAGQGGEVVRGFVPFGEFKPDLRFIGNDGLIIADGVVPVHGTYITAPMLNKYAEIAAGTWTPEGLHVHQQNDNAYPVLHDGVNARIYQVTAAGVVTDVSRAALYTAPIPPYGGWTGCSFGENVVMTNYFNEVQYQAGGAGLFANMITSTFAPQARYCFSYGPNLFLANCYLPAPYDTLPAGANSTVVAWSQNENIRVFGAPGPNPELLGAGYNPCNFDIGAITGGIASDDYAMVSCSNGFIKIDGPPYAFRVVSRGTGSAFCYGMCSVRGDIYFWSPAGLARLPGGEGYAEVIGFRKWSRWLIDNTTGFSNNGYGIRAANQSVGVPGDASAATLNMAHDPVSDLLWTAYTIDGDTQSCRGVLVYNISEDRASWVQVMAAADTPTQVRFMRPARQGNTSAWGPGRELRFISPQADPAGQYMAKLTLGNSLSPGRLGSGFLSPVPGRVCRFKRVRPLYTTTGLGSIETLSMEVLSTNKPYTIPLTSNGPYTAVDAQGWFVCPTTTMAEWHRPVFTVAAGADMHTIVEYRGFEYEAIVGGAYGA